MKIIIERLTDDIRLRGLSPKTEIEYVKRIEIFLKWINKPDDELTEQDFRMFLQHLINDCDLKLATINTYNSALRFLYGVTLDQNLNNGKGGKDRYTVLSDNLLIKFI